MIFIRRAAKRGWQGILPMAICLCLGARLPAQQPNATAGNAAVFNETLKLLVLEGQGAVNDLRIPMATNLVVEVRDENDRPVEGATVNFQLPLMGPSGSFEGGVRNKELMTNVQGQASVSYTPNTERGRFTVQVKATVGGQTGMTSIMQRNAAEGEAAQNGSWIGRHKKLVVLIAVVAAGGIAAIVLTRGGSSSTSSSSSGSTTVTITPGVPTVSAP